MKEKELCDRWGPKVFGGDTKKEETNYPSAKRRSGYGQSYIDSRWSRRRADMKRGGGVTRVDTGELTSIVDIRLVRERGLVFRVLR